MEHIIMPCEEWVEKFAAFRLKDLSAPEQLLLQQHLQECPNCAVVYKTYSALDSRIRAQNTASSQFEQLPDLLPLLEEKEREKQSQAKKYSVKTNIDNSSIKLVARFPTNWTELALDKRDIAECVIEEIAALTLIQIFDSVAIDEVTVSFSSSPSSKGEIIASIYAQGFNPSPSINLNQLDCIIEDRLTQALLELFGVLYVECYALL